MCSQGKAGYQYRLLRLEFGDLVFSALHLRALIVLSGGVYFNSWVFRFSSLTNYTAGGRGYVMFRYSQHFLSDRLLL
jgi:hypothetical protein